MKLKILAIDSKRPEWVRKAFYDYERRFVELGETRYTEEEIIEDKSIIDVNSLKEFLKKKYPKLKDHFDNNDLIRIAINLTYTFENKKINKDDEIALFPPVSGG